MADSRNDKINETKEEGIKEIPKEPPEKETFLTCLRDHGIVKKCFFSSSKNKASTPTKPDTPVNNPPSVSKCEGEMQQPESKFFRVYAQKPTLKNLFWNGEGVAGAEFALGPFRYRPFAIGGNDGLSVNIFGANIKLSADDDDDTWGQTEEQEDDAQRQEETIGRPMTYT